MVRVLEQVHSTRLLHDFAAIHDGNAVAHLGDYGDVVGDQNNRVFQLQADLPDSPEDEQEVASFFNHGLDGLYGQGI